MPTLGQELFRLRKLKGWTLREVEERTERQVSNSYLYQLEKGSAKEPSPNILYQLSLIYDASYPELMRLAGFVVPSESPKASPVGSSVAFSSLDLSNEERDEVMDFIEFRRKKKSAEMRTPPRLAVPPSAPAVAAEVRKLLRAADIGKRLPTPKNEILECTRLVEIGELDLNSFKQSKVGRAADAFYRALERIRGFLDRRSKEIYIDPQLHDSRKTFVTFHEVAHKILPWQQVQYTEDDDRSLSVDCDTLFESEANFGAAEILFQCDRFELEAKDFELAIPSVLHLAERYGASLHSSLRRFVERNHRPCLLLVLKPTSRANEDGGTSFLVSHAVPSRAFTLEFGAPFSQPFINPDQGLGAVLNNDGGEFTLTDLKGVRRTCRVEPFNNQYSHFAMIYPTNVGPSRRRVRLKT